MAKPPSIRVLLVDDHFVVRSGLAAALGAEKDIQVVGEAGDAATALTQYRKLSPDVVTMDGRMPGRSGAEATADILAEFPKARILVLSIAESEEEISRSVNAGAMGYVPKSAGRDELLRAVRCLAGGMRFISPEIAAKLAVQESRKKLTPREVEILALLAAGRANKEIADDLHIAEITAKQHLTRLFQKLGVADRTQAVLEAARRGLIKM